MNNIDKDYITNSIKTYIEECGKFPTVTILIKKYGITQHKLKKYGGIKQFSCEFGYNKVFNSSIRLTKKEFGEILYNHYKDFEFVTQDIISKEYNDGKFPYGYGAVKKYFGSFNCFCKEYGLYHLIKSKKHSYFTEREMTEIFIKRFPNMSMPPSQIEVNKAYKNGFDFSVDMLLPKFGSYSKFLLMAGYEYNRGLYSQKYLADDGEVCDSKTEYQIDLFLHDNNIKHSHQNKYYEIVSGLKRGSKVDFLLCDGTIVEYFGLVGNKRYDQKLRKKVEILETNNIKYIAIYPEDLSKMEILFKDYLGGGDGL